MYKLNTPIQLGILGCGSFVQRRILPILKTMDAISVVALQKRNLTEAQKVAEKYNIPHAVSTRDDLLKLPQVEAVLIATTNHMHEQDALACASHLKPTLCEKPLAPSALVIEKMIKAFQKQDLPLCVGQSLRFKFCLQKAKQLLQSGKLGQLLSIQAYFSIPLSKDNWRHQKAMGGGVLQDIGVHLIDLIRFISGQEIHSIFAQANHDYQIVTPKAEQTVTAICRLADQSISSFECSFIHPFANRFEVIGTKARLVSNDSLRQSDNSNETFCLIENDAKSYLPVPLSNIYFDELMHFVDSIKGNPSIITAEEGLQNQKVIDAAYHSIQKESYIKVR